MKYNYKIIYTSTQGKTGVIGINAKSMVEAAEMAKALADGLPDEVSEIKSIELRSTKHG